MFKDKLYRELKELMFKDKLYISESISAENNRLFYICRKLKSRGVIDSTWFFNNVINMRLLSSSRIYKITHETDIKSILPNVNLDESTIARM